MQGVQSTGKTFLLCALAEAVSNGGLVQGTNGLMERIKQGRVLYMSGDDSPMTITKRLTETFNANRKNICFQAENTTPYIGSPEFAEYFRLKRPDLCIIDTLQHFLPPRTNMNSTNEVTLALQPLRILSNNTIAKNLQSFLR
ncbi:MAG: helicase RepA family protein [Oscillospiraceae bacterium]|nr:helicase RepA family protein [Oscillospiraceae bacterium]